MWPQLKAGDSVPLLLVQRKATKITGGMEHLFYWERLRDVGLFSLEEKRFWRELSVVLQYLTGVCKKDGERLFSRAWF